MQKKYLKEYIDQREECPYYEAENFDIGKMKKDGYTGYFWIEKSGDYDENGYGTLNACIIKSAVDIDSYRMG